MNPKLLTRRQVLALSAGSLAMPSFGASFPDRPIRLMVAFPAGGGPDLLARSLAEALRATKGWNVVVVNRPGAGGNLGTAEVAQAPADGHTALFGHVGALAVNPSLFKQLNFDPLKDFAPVGMIATSPLVLVTGPEKSYASLRDLLADARKRPGQVTVGYSGSGTISHLSMTQIVALAGVNVLLVPYKGASQGLVDVMGGQYRWLHLVDGVLAGPCTHGQGQRPCHHHRPAFARHARGRHRGRARLCRFRRRHLVRHDLARGHTGASGG